MLASDSKEHIDQHYRKLEWEPVPPHGSRFHLKRPTVKLIAEQKEARHAPCAATVRCLVGVRVDPPRREGEAIEDQMGFPWAGAHGMTGPTEDHMLRHELAATRDALSEVTEQRDALATRLARLESVRPRRAGLRRPVSWAAVLCLGAAVLVVAPTLALAVHISMADAELAAVMRLLNVKTSKAAAQKIRKLSNMLGERRMCSYCSFQIAKRSLKQTVAGNPKAGLKIAKKALDVHPNERAKAAEAIAQCGLKNDGPARALYRVVDPRGRSSLIAGCKRFGIDVKAP